MDGWIDGWKDERIDGLMGEQMDGGTDSWMDRLMGRQTVK